MAGRCLTGHGTRPKWEGGVCPVWISRSVYEQRGQGRRLHNPGSSGPVDWGPISPTRAGTHARAHTYESRALGCPGASPCRPARTCASVARGAARAQVPHVARMWVGSETRGGGGGTCTAVLAHDGAGACSGSWARVGASWLWAAVTQAELTQFGVIEGPGAPEEPQGPRRRGPTTWPGTRHRSAR